MITALLGFSRQVEILVIILSGICFLAFDSSLLHLKSNLEEVWKYEFDPLFHKNNFDLYIKYVLSGVILVRTFTLHIFLAFYIVMLWPAIFENRPNLMLPWLVVGSVRSIFVNLVTLSTGSYVCFAQKGCHLICLDFILSQFIQHGPSVYAWLTILSYYQNLKNYCREKEKKSKGGEAFSGRKTDKCNTAPEGQVTGKVNRRSSIRSYLSDFTVYNILHEVDKGDGCQLPLSRSLDSLIKIKYDDDGSMSTTTQEDENKTVSERVIALLNITTEDINKIKAEKLNSLENCNNIEKCITKSASLQNVTRNHLDSKNKDKTKVAETTQKRKCKITKNSEIDEVEIRSISFEKFDQPPNCSKKLNANNGESEEVIRIHNLKGQDEACQVCTLNKVLLNLPPKDVMRKFQFAKTLILK